MDGKNIPHNMIAIKVTPLPSELVEKGTLGDFLNMLSSMIDARKCILSYDGKRITPVEMFYCDTDSWFIGVKEAPLYELLKYAEHFYATITGIFDTDTGSYLRFEGFRLIVKTKGD
jgi:hypothetical protein